MPKYIVVDAKWLEREIRNAELLREHAGDTGKPVAIAAAGVRAESLKEIERLGSPDVAEEKGVIQLWIAEEPRAPARGE